MTLVWIIIGIIVAVCAAVLLEVLLRGNRGPRNLADSQPKMRGPDINDLPDKAALSLEATGTDRARRAHQQKRRSAEGHRNIQENTHRDNPRG